MSAPETQPRCTACHGRGERLHGWAVCPKACEDCGGTGRAPAACPAAALPVTEADFDELAWAAYPLTASQRAAVERVRQALIDRECRVFAREIDAWDRGAA